MRRLLLGAGLFGALVTPAYASGAASSPGLPATGGSSVTAASSPGLPTPGGDSVMAARALHGPAPETSASASVTSASTLTIRGGGFGHGIGMSQYGAYGDALHGWSYRSILAHYYTGTSLGQVSSTQTVRVLLKTGSAAFSGAGHAAGKALTASSTYSVRLASGGKLALVSPAGKTLGTYSSPLVATGSGPLTVPGLGSYRGALEFRPDGAGGVQTVDAVGLDSYVRGVVAAEMPAGWAAQALDAQAVAARTYALTTTVSGNGYSLYSDTRSQMYRGVAAETPSTDAAVAATAGQVVTLHGSAVPTLFFASSGGATENIEDVWSGAPADAWLRGVSDPYDNAGANPYYRWTYTLSLTGAQARLGSLLKGSLIAIKVLSHGYSPRVMSAQIVGTAGTTTVSGATLASVFGLPSTYASFTVVSTTAGATASGSSLRTTSSGWLPAKLTAAAVGGVVPALRGLAAAAGLHGWVSPAGGARSVLAQRLESGRWTSVTRAGVSTGGRYAVAVGTPGTYRVIYDGVDGQGIKVG